MFIHESTDLLDNLRQIFEERGYEVLTTTQIRQAREWLRSGAVTFVSLGINATHEDFPSFLSFLARHAKTIPVLAELELLQDLEQIHPRPTNFYVAIGAVASTAKRIELIERLVPPSHAHAE